MAVEDLSNLKYSNVILEKRDEISRTSLRTLFVGSMYSSRWTRQTFLSLYICPWSEIKAWYPQPAIWYQAYAFHVGFNVYITAHLLY